MIEEIGVAKLEFTLPTGEKIYKSKIKVFVQEVNNGQGGWKTVTKEKTWWPTEWSDEKIWEKISEAFKNKIEDGNGYVGTTSDGIKINIFTDTIGEISTAYIIK